MAAVLGGQGRDERRPPARDEAVNDVSGAETREPGVDEPELLVGPGHLVDLHVARDVARARQEAGVVPPGRLELGRGRGNVVKFPDLEARAERQPVARDGKPHRAREAAEVRVQALALGPDDDQLARLVGGHQQRDAELIEEGGEVGGMDAAERRRAGLSGSRWPGGFLAAVRGVGRCLGVPATRDLARERHHPSPVAGPDDFAVLR